MDFTEIMNNKTKELGVLRARLQEITGTQWDIIFKTEKTPEGEKYFAEFIPIKKKTLSDKEIFIGDYTKGFHTIHVKEALKELFDYFNELKKMTSGPSHKWDTVDVIDKKIKEIFGKELI